MFPYPTEVGIVRDCITVEADKYADLTTTFDTEIKEDIFNFQLDAGDHQRGSARFCYTPFCNNFVWGKLNMMLSQDRNHIHVTIEYRHCSVHARSVWRHTWVLMGPVSNKMLKAGFKSLYKYAGLVVYGNYR